jgi:glycosyltransferase involved in cell wall biosynthesis
MSSRFDLQREKVLHLLVAGSEAQFDSECHYWAEQAKSNQELSVISAVRGTRLALQRKTSAIFELQKALMLDSNNLSALLNLHLLQADGVYQELPPLPRQSESKIKVAVLSFLFNWPSTGGGIVHTVELCDFLQRAGYEVQHFYVEFPEWEIGVVTGPLPMKSHVIRLKPQQWNAVSIQQAYRQAVDQFQPDYAIITDSWNMKPVLADAIKHIPYLLRLQALECLCPLNNIRLLPSDEGRGFKQCQLNQLATPKSCRECIQQRGQRSGSLHQDERQLAGVDTPEYSELLRRVFKEAHAVLVVNPLTEAMVAPYATQVKTVTAGMDPARFPDPWPHDPAPSFGNRSKTILFAGLIDETIKGFAVLHEACARLWKVRHNFELHVTCDGPSPIDEFTRAVGWQTQSSLPSVMRGADIVAVPAIAQEALGRTAVEAMAAGRPVVASRLGGLPFTIADGATGLLAEPGDPADLAEKLARLLDDGELRNRMGLAGRQRFIEHFAWPVIIEKHYRSLLTKAHRKIT